MRCSTSLRFFTSTLLWLLGGCALPEPTDIPFPADIVAPVPEAETIRLDLHEVPGYGDIEMDFTQFLSDTTPTSLSATRCACLAASRSQLAAVLEKEAMRARRDSCRRSHRGGSAVLPDILMNRAAQARIEAAEEALIAFYQLADVQLQKGVLAASREELDRVEQAVSTLIAAGFPVDMDLTELDRRRAELNRQAIQLDIGELRLTAHLKTLMGEEPFSGGAIETSCTVRPRSVEYELSEAGEIARANDFELKSIGSLLNHGQVSDMDVARSLLRAAEPLLGQAPPSLGFLGKLRLALGCGENERIELTLIKDQLRDLYQARQGQVELEVAERVVGVQQQLVEVGIAKDVFTIWDERVQALESQRESQKSSYGDLVEARYERLKAKSDLQHQLMLLEIEHVKLESTLGLLTEQCSAAESAVASHTGAVHSRSRPALQKK